MQAAAQIAAAIRRLWSIAGIETKFVQNVLIVIET
jgi:hypothetical protein